MTTAPRWLTLFLDIPAANHEAGCAFWQAATGHAMSSPRGTHGEFATLVPPAGDAHLRIQSIRTGEFRVHVDLHVDDLDAAVEHALAVGAHLVARPDHAILRSPAGFVFCLVTGHGGTTRATPANWGDHRSLPDQLTVDVAHDAWEREKTFWSELTGWTVAPSARPEFARLRTPPTLPVRVLLQRLDDGATTGHLDIATDHRAAEVARLTRLGARELSGGPSWTVMTGPDHSIFCVTDRDPATGLLP
ncbi:VOC family protein [Myceligenerans crystallogenes]|uniref:Glyoxalase-like domain-containing protein n=1 Tax=Myceligenerans crystallogenes TaxID=316335 RepID=A0ABN2NJ09_9MICO